MDLYKTVLHYGSPKTKWLPENDVKKILFYCFFFANVNYSLQGYLRVVFFKQEDEEVNVIGGE